MIYNRSCIGLIVAFFIFLSSCSLQKISTKRNNVASLNYIEVCDTITKERSIFYSKVDALIEFNQVDYETKISLFYIPDSVLYFSLSNLGFEIFRGFIFKDSTNIINRIDKIVYVLNSSSNNHNLPINFYDLELLLSNFKICQNKGQLSVDEGIFIDRSLKNIKKFIFLDSFNFERTRFEFFHKKTGEYFVGDKVDNGDLDIFGNMLIGKFSVKVQGGHKSINVEKCLNYSFNRSKYKVIYL